MNSRKYTMTSLSIVFLAITMITVSGLGQNAYAAGMSLSVDADYASGSISISGDTDRSGDVSILVTAENGNISAVAQVTPSGGSYSSALGLADMDGTYTVSAKQGVQLAKYKMSVEISSSSQSGYASTIIEAEVDALGNEVSNKTGVEMPEVKSVFSLSATGVEGSTTIDVSGTTERSDEIVIKVTAPNGNIVVIDQITPSNGSFATTIEVGGPLWSQDGTYIIKARQGATPLGGSLFGNTADDMTTGLLHYQASAEVEVVDGHVIPEFGVIAGVILAVAIASIIAVSAKSRLALVPKY